MSNVAIHHRNVLSCVYSMWVILFKYNSYIRDTDPYELTAGIFAKK